MAAKVRVLVVGLGNMGVVPCQRLSRNPGFEICRPDEPQHQERRDLPAELEGYPTFQDFRAALAETRPDAVSINTWPNTHAELAHARDGRRLPRVHGKADRDQHRGREGRGRQGARRRTASSCSATSCATIPAGRSSSRSADARQALGHAHEPQPADPLVRPGTGTRT